MRIMWLLIDLNHTKEKDSISLANTHIYKLPQKVKILKATIMN